MLSALTFGLSTAWSTIDDSDAHMYFVKSSASLTLSKCTCVVEVSTWVGDVCHNTCWPRALLFPFNAGLGTMPFWCGEPAQHPFFEPRCSPVSGWLTDNLRACVSLTVLQVVMCNVVPCLKFVVHLWVDDWLTDWLKIWEPVCDWVYWWVL